MFPFGMKEMPPSPRDDVLAKILPVTARMNRVLPSYSGVVAFGLSDSINRGTESA